MINTISILAARTQNGVTFVMPALVSLLPLILFIWGIVWLIRYLKRLGEERQRLRMEVSKLADELEQLRKQSELKNAGSAESQ